MTNDLTFTAGATSVQIANSADVAKLNKALRDPAQFKQFQTDPKAFAAKHNVKIDDSAAAAIKRAVASAGHVGDIAGPGTRADAATVAAVADGAFATASSKIAVAAFGGFASINE